MESLFFEVGEVVCHARAALHFKLSTGTPPRNEYLTFDANVNGNH